MEIISQFKKFLFMWVNNSFILKNINFYKCFYKNNNSHSLGGYIVSSYAIAFPQYIRGLYLLSPAGLAKAN